MAVRKDTVQLNIEFITDESRQLAKANANTRALTTELRKTVKEGGDVADVMRRISEAGAQVENIDLSRVAPDQLITRARQLRQILGKMPESAPGVAKLQAEYKRINDRLATVRQNSRGVADSFGGSDGLLGVLKRGQVLALAFVGAFVGLFSSLGGIIRATGLFQKFGAVLTNTLGSRSEAQKAIRDVTRLADELNIPADLIISSYTKLVNRGIKPTTAELTNLLDLAASQGKTLDDLAEGALDAATGEFERLKEFGIRAKAQGDQVELSFKGQTQTVAKTQDAILEVLLGYGELAGVQGSAAAASDNLAGKQTKLLAVFDRLLANLGQGGLGDAIGAAIDNATALLRVFIDLTSVQEGLTGEVRNTQAAFNLEIETLKRGNLSAETRASLIESINTKYADYLPNLLSEESTLGDIAQAQELVNRQFEQRIILLAAEEQLTDISRRRLQAKKEELDLELALTEANERRIGAGERAARSETSQAFLGSGVLKAQAGQAAANSSAEQALERLNAKKQEQIDLEAEFQQSLAAAKALGLDINTILNPPGSSLGGGGGGGGGGKATIDKRLKEIQEASDQLRALAARDRINEETTEKEYNARLSEIREQEFTQQLQAYTAFGQQRLAVAEELRNELLALERRRAEAPQLAIATIGQGRAALGLGDEGGPDRVDRRNVDAQLEALADQAEREADLLQKFRNEKQINEDQFELGRLELKRTLALEEIEILRQGTAEEVALANEKATQIGEIDQQIFDKKAALAEREAELRKNLEDLKVQTATEAVDAIVSVLGRDEAARKKNAQAIKAFQKGQAIISGLNEISNIRTATAAQAASVGILGPAAVAAVNILGAIRVGAAIAQTAVTVGKINSQQFARGGGVKFGRFGGNRHSNGGNRGVFEDGTQVEVERGEDFFILSREASAERARLSALNESSGGVPFFERGGNVFGAPATTPTIASGLLPAAGSNDTSAMNGTMSALLDAFQRFPTKLTAAVVYGDITDAADDLNTARYASET